MALKILVVEDDPSILELLQFNLETAGYHVAAAPTAEEGALQLEEQDFDLLVLDWMLPDMSGIELCSRVRKSGRAPQLPIIMLTARGEEGDRVRGLSTGADDYMVKPFSVPELLARVKSLLRRASPERVTDVLTIADIIMDRAAHRVMRGAREVALGPTEYRLLEVLMESAGRVLTRNQLIDRVWGFTAEIDERTIDVHIGRLRKSLIRGKQEDPIRTVRGTGYVLDVR
jgi:two-component system phosphate regulon response regulator PhoB